jgi:acyl-coenzyme A thioesterase PaaI-like protein
MDRFFAELPWWKCFACAPVDKNPQGLHLHFEEIPNGARTQFSLSEGFQSYPGYLHGGILATILDETMAYALVYRFKKLPFTKSFQISYRRAVSAGRSYECESQIEKGESEVWHIKGLIREKGRGILVTAGAQFVLPTYELAVKMLSETDLSECAHLFR